MRLFVLVALFVGAALSQCVTNPQTFTIDASQSGNVALLVSSAGGSVSFASAPAGGPATIDVTASGATMQDAQNSVVYTVRGGVCASARVERAA